MKNLNEQIERINQLSEYKVGVVINEQSSTGCNYSDYQNGDGIKKPKITVTKSPTGVDLTYEGPETGFCIQHSKGSTGDSIHQLAGVTRVIVSQYLKELYKQGTFVYPDLKNIGMTKKDKFFSINVPFVKTTESKAITNFNERGGWGHTGNDSFNDFLSTISDTTKYGLVTKETKVASGGNSPDITENWVSFRDLEKFPIMTSTEGVDESNEKIEKIEHNNNPNILRERLKKLGVIINPSVKYVGTNNGYVEVKYLTNCPNEGKCDKVNLSYVFSDSGEEDTVLEKVKIKNTIVDEIDYSMKGVKGYIITIQQ
jgi:hypothetical protein